MSIYCVKSYYILVPHVSGISCQGEVLETGAARPLVDGLRFSLLDWEVECLITSALSEALSSSAITLEHLADSEISTEELPAAEFSLASTGKSIPLFPDVRYLVGSAAGCALHLALEGIAPRHCSLMFSNTAIIVAALDGEVLLDGQALEGALARQQNSTVTLQPTGVSIRLCFPERSELLKP